MNPVDPASAFAALISTWGAPGALIVLLIIGCGWLAWWLRNSHRERLADAQKRNDELRADLIEKYKDAEATRDILRELKGSIDLNTRTIETTLDVLRTKS